MEFKPTTTIAEVKAYLRRESESGVKCPCCNQFVKVYKRKLNSGMARGLITAYHIQMQKNGDYFHAVREFSKRKENASTLEFSKLRYWGLVEQKPSLKDPKKKDSGYWKLTERGIRFVRGEAKVQKYVRLYDGRFLGLADDFIDIRDALGDDFNYQELMQS